MTTLGTQTAAGIDNFVNNRIITLLKDLDERPAMARMLYDEHPWNPASGDTVEFDTSALSGLAGTVSELSTIPAARRVEGNTLTKRQLQYGRAFEITKRMKKFNKFKKADADARSTARAIKFGFDKDLTDQFFTQADNTAYAHRTEGTINIATADGQAPASASHTVTGTGATTYSNLINGATGLALSTDNYTTALEAPNRTAVDDEGTLISDAEYSNLSISQNQDMLRKAKQLFGSSKEPEVFENAINIYSDGRRKIFVLNRGNQTPTGAPGGASLARYRWNVCADELKHLQAVMVAQEPDIQLESVNENNLVARVVADMFGAYAMIGWQQVLFFLF